MALSPFRAPILPLALMGAVAALVYSQRRRGPAVPPGGFPEPGVPPTGIGVPAPAGAEYVYCNNPGGCTLTEQDGSAVGTASYGSQLVVTDRMEGWVRVRGREGQGWARETSLTSIDPILGAPIPSPPTPPAPPPLGPGDPAPGGPPLGTARPDPLREPRRGDPCLEENGCVTLPLNAIDPRGFPTRTPTPDLRRATFGTVVPPGGRVDVLEGPVVVRRREERKDIFGIEYGTPITIFEHGHPLGEPDVRAYYRIRYCTPGTTQCFEGWVLREALVK